MPSLPHCLPSAGSTSINKSFLVKHSSKNTHITISALIHSHQIEETTLVVILHNPGHHTYLTKAKIIKKKKKTNQKMITLKSTYS